MVVYDQGSLVVGIVVTTLALGGIFIFARTITRTIIRPQFGWDDGLIIFTWFLVLGYNAAVFASVKTGYGRHVYELTPDQYRLTVRSEVISQVLAISAFPSGKASIAVLLLRLFPGRKLRWSLWFFVIGNAVFFYIDALLVLIQYQPVAYQWDRRIEGGTCWSPRVVIDWGFLTGVFGAVTDFTFAILPWFYISRLRIDIKDKISVGVALSVGLFAGACSILKIYYTWTLGIHEDFTYDTVPLVIWSSVELASINIAACIPTLRPLYQWVTGGNSRQSIETSDVRSFRSRYGNLSRSARVEHGSAGLDSAGEHDSNIYRSETFEVTVQDRKDELSSESNENEPTVTIGYPYLP